MTSEKTFATSRRGRVGRPLRRVAKRKVGEDSLELASGLLARSRRSNIPVTKAFARADVPGVEPMLYRLYSGGSTGGRSGVVAIKLYLALIWRCSAAPYQSRRDSARTWATLLDLPDPADKGARRIRAALQTLKEENLIRLTPDPGYPPTITLLAESGDGSPYEPASLRGFNMNRGRVVPSVQSYYFQVPAQMWVQGFMQSLSGPALMVYLALASEQAYQRDQWFSTEQFPARFLISAQTRAAGTKELQRDQLLKVSTRLLDEGGNAVSFGRLRRRNTYRLLGAAVPGEE